MGRKPCGPWRRLAESEASQSLGEWEGAPHLFKYATLYAAVRRHATPDVVDGWESWQAAAFLGIGIPEPEESGDVPSVGGRDIAVERAEYLLAQQQGRDVAPPAPDVPRPPSNDPRFMESFANLTAPVVTDA